MLEGLMLICIIICICCIFYGVYKLSMKANSVASRGGLIKLVATAPINYKLSAHIIQVDGKYFLCCENCGMTEIEYSGNLDSLSKEQTFQSILADELGKINIAKFLKKENK